MGRHAVFLYHFDNHAPSTWGYKMALYTTYKLRASIPVCTYMTQYPYMTTSQAGSSPCVHVAEL